MSDDYEKLLAEVERSMGGAKPAPAAKPSRAPRKSASRAEVETDDSPGRLASAGRTAVVAGGAAAVAIYVLFALTPFLRAASGAWGAFIATTVAVFITSYLRRP